MKLLFVSSNRYPYPTGNGAAVLMHALITCYRRLGYEVTLVPASLRNPEDREKAEPYWEAEGVPVHRIPAVMAVKTHKSRAALVRRALLPRLSDHFHMHDVPASGLQEFVVSGGFDLVVSYGWEALGVIAGLDHPDKVASLVDPLDSLIELMAAQNRFGFSMTKLRGWLKFKAASHKPAYADLLLSKVHHIFEHAYQHCEELRARGYRNAHYFPHPLPRQDELPPKQPSDQVTVLILGSLKGTAGRYGFEFFLDKVMPRLEPKLAKLDRRVVFRIVGHGELKSELRERLEANPYCDFVGFVDKVEPEFAGADIMLVNIPVAHGFRTRIAEAFGYGKCVVAHAANATGMPELRDEDNALTAADPDLFTQKLLRAIEDPELRVRLGRKARETFEAEICQDAAVGKIAAVLGLPN
ncbi:MAG: glycosyltransferase family 4 protein [Acidobacteriota bacterium]|nr:glycosyltransferase family 4 protein [Acidobacteriota bacterium]